MAVFLRFRVGDRGGLGVMMLGGGEEGAIRRSLGFIGVLGSYGAIRRRCFNYSSSW